MSPMAAETSPNATLEIMGNKWRSQLEKKNWTVWIRTKLWMSCKWWWFDSKDLWRRWHDLWHANVKNTYVYWYMLSLNSCVQWPRGRIKEKREREREQERKKSGEEEGKGNIKAMTLVRQRQQIVEVERKNMSGGSKWKGLNKASGPHKSELSDILINNHSSIKKGLW